MWTRLTYFIQSNRHLGPWFVVGRQVNNLAQCDLVTGTGMLETGNWQALLRCRIIISTRQRRSSKAHNFNTPGARGTSCKMMRTAPRLVYNTAAGAASTSGGHFANSATFRRPSPKSSDASTSTSPTRTADQAEWEFVKPSESPAWSVESLGPVPSAEEAREATRYMVESLTGSEEVSSFLQVHHQWPEADASLARSEAALKMVSRVTNVRQRPAVLQEAFDYHMTISTQSGALHDVVKWLKEDPAEAKDVAMSLATDEAVWAAVGSNAKVRAILAKTSSDYALQQGPTQVTEVGSTEEEQSQQSFKNIFKMIAAKAGELVDSLGATLAKLFGYSEVSKDGPDSLNPSASGDYEGKRRLGAMVCLAVLLVIGLLVKRVRVG